jgi:hypothetical protein
LSVSKLTHSPLQLVRLDWQESVQAPEPLQTLPEAQPVPQVPSALQKRLSVSKLTHSPLQLVRLDWQESAQTPEPLQTLPAAQPVPQVLVALQ